MVSISTRKRELFQSVSVERCALCYVHFLAKEWEHIRHCYSAARHQISQHIDELKRIQACFDSKLAEKEAEIERLRALGAEKDKMINLLANSTPE